MNSAIGRQRRAAPSPSFLARMFGISPPVAAEPPRSLHATGEIAVAATLDSLPSEWTVFHSHPIGNDAPIHHLLVGPGGIFTIVTAEHGGQTVSVGKRHLTVAGEDVMQLRQAEAEAQRVTDLVRPRMPLLTPAQPVIAIVDAMHLTISERPEQVKVIAALELRSWLIRLHPVLTAGEVQEVADLVERPEAWRALDAGGRG